MLWEIAARRNKLISDDLASVPATDTHYWNGVQEKRIHEKEKKKKKYEQTPKSRFDSWIKRKIGIDIKLSINWFFLCCCSRYMQPLLLMLLNCCVSHRSAYVSQISCIAADYNRSYTINVCMCIIIYTYRKIVIIKKVTGVFWRWHTISLSIAMAVAVAKIIITTTTPTSKEERKKNYNSQEISKIQHSSCFLERKRAIQPLSFHMSCHSSYCTAS